MLGRSLRLLALGVLALSAAAAAQPLTEAAERRARVAPPTDLPAGFFVEDTAGGATFTTPVDVAAAPDGRLFVAQKNGLVFVVDGGVKLATPFLDLSAEVLDHHDRGLLGIALDPAFAANGHVYLLYTVDVGGTDAARSDAFGRLTRYTASGSDPNRADLASRLVLLGKTFGTGLAACSPSHAPATLRFGADGTLLVGAGDGASFSAPDGGGLHAACFGPGRLDPSEDVGAFRSLMLSSPAGKILRVDPATGRGLSSNPFYTGDPADVASKVWAYGVRNPFRFAVLPDGDPDPAAGRPGTVVLGDVGWRDIEEIDVAVGGEGFGWPCFEGPGPLSDYQSGSFPSVSCASALAPLGPQAAPDLFWDHRSPSISSPPGRIGAAIVGGDVYRGTGYPTAYRGAVFYADYVRGWLAVGRIGAGGAFVETELFSRTTGPVVDIEYDASTETLLLVDIGAGQVLRLGHVGGGSNNPPVAVASAQPSQGTAPLAVQFLGSGSSDPEGGALAFGWDFGDGATSALADPTHTYAAPGDYTATLTVTDPFGADAQTTLTVTVGAGPGPTAQIAAPAAGAWARVGATVALQAAPAPGVTFEWDVVQVHNDHEHFDVASATGPDASFVIPDHGGPDEVVYYVVRLTATDGGGLTDVAEHRVYVDRSGAGLPSPWVSADIGAVPVAGLASGDGSAITVLGGGAVEGTIDAFHFAHRALGDDGVITARLADLVCGFPWAKVGLMIRETLDPESPHVMVVGVQGEGVRLQYRPARGSALLEAASRPGEVPVWLRLERVGDVVTAFSSDDGVTWSPVGAVSLAMDRGLHIGLMATATDFEDRGLVAHGAFTDVSVEPGPGGPALPPGGGVPLPWVAQDVGFVAAPGDASHAAGRFQLEGSGDVWGTDDGFHFVHQPLDGDGTLTARVADVAGEESWAKAGLMIRASLAAGARHAMLVATPGEGVHLQYRTTADGPMQSTSGPPGPAPVWLRLERDGAEVRASTSADGAAWTPVGTVGLGLPSTVEVGMMVTGTDRGGSGVTAVATFDGVALILAEPDEDAPLPDPWLAADVGPVLVAGRATTADGEIRIEGSGDVWEAADAFHFAYQPLSGASSVTARILGVSGVRSWAKSGLMIRADLTPGSPHAMLVGTSAQGFHLQYRTAPDAAMESASVPLDDDAAPAWLRLERDGDLVTASVSTDGVTWLGAGTLSIPYASTAYVGLMATGTDYSGEGVLGIGTFENVEFTGTLESSGGAVAGAPTPSTGFGIEAVFPNPFVGRATVRIATDAPGRYALDVLDLLGRRVSGATVDAATAGPQHVPLDLSGQSAGTYVVRLRGPDAVAHRRVLLVR